MSGRSVLLSVLLTSLVACTSSRGPDRGDASVAPLEKRASAADVVKVVAAHTELRVGRGVLLEKRDNGYGLRKVRAFGSNVAAMDVTLPVTANGATHLTDPSRAGFDIELVPETTASAGEPLDGALVFPNAAPDTDVVQVLEPNRYEELRVLRSPRAGAVARWHVNIGRGVASIYVRDNIVEAFDTDGRVRVRTEPAFALDNKGVRRDVTLTLEEHDGDRILTAQFDDKGLEYPIVLDPTWYTALPVMPSTYFYDTSWLTLPDNRVIAFGSFARQKPAVYNPSTETWTLEAYESDSRGFGVLTQLGTGKILNSGGSGRTAAELWTVGAAPVATGSLSVARMRAGYVHLNKGVAGEKVIVYGGSADGNPPGATTAEEYSVATGTWAVRPVVMPAGRFGHTATDMGDGTVLIIGGRGPWVNTALLHDVAADSYTTLTSTMPNARADHVTIRLTTTNKLLIVGGTTGAYATTNTTTLYDIATKTFSAGPLLNAARQEFAVVPYGTGKWMLIGGSSGGTTLSTTEIYDETANTFTLGPPLSFSIERQGAAVLPDGRIITGGGIQSGTYGNKVQVLLPDPKTCTTAGDCTTGFCVDGYCCNKACNGQCEACDVPSRLGVCLVVAGEQPHGSRPSCGSYLYCGSDGNCQTSCSSDAACLAGNYCTGPSGTCVPKKANGSGCTGANECTSGNCADKVCCNAPCAGQCEACAESGSVGTCTLVDGVPRSPRTACPAPYACAGGTCANATTGCTKDVECGTSYYCNGTSCVAKIGNGTACTRAGQCASGNCVDGYCCNTACNGTCDACDVVKGTCSAVPSGGDPHAPKTCGGYKCNGASACLSGCTTDAQCTGDSYCLAGACVAKKANGGACSTNKECTSAICAAGVCCGSACTGECETCATGTCAPKTSGTACGIAGCIGSYMVSRGSCSGTDNTCSAGTVTECPGSLKCASATACKTSCATTADCVRGTCDTTSGTCILVIDGGIDTGAPDTFVADTAEPDTFVADTLVPDTFVADTAEPDTFVPDTFVPDTFVPDTFVPDTTVADTLAIAEEPAPKLPEKPEVKAEFTRCTKGSDCPSGFCVEGVCCNSECKQRCFSCALLNTPGICTQEPTGVDLKSECGPALSCLGTCGPGGECVGAGTGTMCARNRCTGPSTGAGPAYCAAPGAKCNTDEAVPFDCGAYVCEPAFGACRSTCASTKDCAQGFVCDTPTKTCVAAPPPPAESGDDGCAVSTPGASRGGLAVAGLLVALGLVARRRRAA